MILPARTPDDKIALLAYLANKIGTAPTALVAQMPFEICGVTIKGKPAGAVLYINYRHNSIEMACAGEGGWLTRGHLRDLFRYPFLQLKCWTVLTMVERGNAKAREFNRKLGFTEKCVLENGHHKLKDVILHSMTRDQCRWIGTATVANKSAPQLNGAYAHG